MKRRFKSKKLIFKQLIITLMWQWQVNRRLRFAESIQVFVRAIKRVVSYLIYNNNDNCCNYQLFFMSSERKVALYLMRESGDRSGRVKQRSAIISRESGRRLSVTVAPKRVRPLCSTLQTGILVEPTHDISIRKL